MIRGAHVRKPGAGKTVADFPWLVQQWRPTKNGGRQPHAVQAGTGESLWWKCDQGADHEWEAQVRSRTIRGARCPFCTNRRVAPSNSLAITHPDIAADWHPTRNGIHGPADFTYGSYFEAWWQCPARQEPRLPGAHRGTKQRGWLRPVCR